MGIVRYDTKTKKKKVIVPYENDDGYSNLIIEGKYIYAVRDLSYGSGAE